MSKHITPLLFVLALTVGCDGNNYGELAAVTEQQLAAAEADLSKATENFKTELKRKSPGRPNSSEWHQYWSARPEVLDAIQEEIDVAETKYDEALAEHEKSIVLRDSLHTGITFMEASQMVEQYQDEYNKAYLEFDSFFSKIESMDLSTLSTPQEFANIDAKADRLRDARDAAENQLRRAIAIRDVLRPSLN